MHSCPFLSTGQIFAFPVTIMTLIRKGVFLEVCQKLGTQRRKTQAINCAHRQHAVKCFDDRRRAQVFVRDQTPNSVNIGLYILLSISSAIVIPLIYPQLRLYHVVVIYLSIPLFSFCNTYGSGITDNNLASSYGKLAMILFGSWVGRNNGRVIAELVTCGVMMGAISNGTDLTQDLKTGYVTLTSPPHCVH